MDIKCISLIAQQSTNRNNISPFPILYQNYLESGNHKEPSFHSACCRAPPLHLLHLVVRNIKVSSFSNETQTQNTCKKRHTKSLKINESKKAPTAAYKEKKCTHKPKRKKKHKNKTTAPMFLLRHFQTHFMALLSLSI